MITPELTNAIIESTMLGTQDHGILTCYLYLKYGDSSGQGFGGYAFCTPLNRSSTDFHRVGTAYGMEFVRRILITLEVERWEDLKGKHCRARHDWNRCYAIGHIIKDTWFEPEKDLALLKSAKP